MVCTHYDLYSNPNTLAGNINHIPRYILYVLLIICDWICEKPASVHNYKYLEIFMLIILSAVSWEGKQMLACNLPQFYSYS